MDVTDFKSLLQTQTLKSMLDPSFTPPSTSPHPLLNSLSSSELKPSALVVQLEKIRDEMVKALLDQPRILLSLNESRKKQICERLCILNNEYPKKNERESLSYWIEMYEQAAHHPISSIRRTLEKYFEELSSLYIAQALVLKNWTDRGLATLTEEDYIKFDWVMSQRLKPKSPIDREGWLIVRKNIYSWYRPPSVFIKKLHALVDTVKFTDESPDLLRQFIEPTRKLKASHYDYRFFQSLWKETDKLINGKQTPSGFQSNRLQLCFSPTLLDGDLVRSAPSSYKWVGFEHSEYNLLITELLLLWWGPIAPPLWTFGNGLEAHPNEQISLEMSRSPGAITHHTHRQISHLESCEIAFVFEDELVRPQGKKIHSLLMREQIEKISSFKKYKSTQVSLGSLQAVVSLSKLRPGGYLWWTRAEPLTHQETPELLHSLLDRGTIIAEWNFSQLSHHLPGGRDLFPKYLYLIRREHSMETRHAHKPLRLSIRGQLRSHVALEVLLDDALSAPRDKKSPRGPWEILIHLSQFSQKNWYEHWPDPACQKELETMTRLEQNSVRLGSLMTVRPVHSKVHPSESESNLLVAIRINDRTLEVNTLSPKLAYKGDYLIVCPDEQLKKTMQAYFETDLLKIWLTHQAEKKLDRYLIHESLIKWIPIPHALVSDQSMKDPTLLRQTHEFLDLSENYEKQRKILEQTEVLITPEGKLRWLKLCKLMNFPDLIPILKHPGITSQGTLQPQVAITKIERIMNPELGYMLCSESGGVLQLTCHQRILFEILQNVFEEMPHSTLQELNHFVHLPHRMDLLESTASSILQTHTEQQAKVRGITQSLRKCIFF